MRLKSVIAALAILVLAAGCTQGPGGGPSKQNVGLVTGAALGGAVGSLFGSGKGKVIPAAVGVFLGALIGSEIGRSMDEVDRIKLDQANAQAKTAPIGETITWNNPDTGNYGSVTPVRDGTSTSGRYCREFQQTVTVGGKTESAYGTACRQPDGSWQIVN